MRVVTRRWARTAIARCAEVRTSLKRLLWQLSDLWVTGIESKHDLMSSKFGSYGEMNKGFTGDDVKGFARIFGNQASIYHKVNDPDQ